MNQKLFESIINIIDSVKPDKVAILTDSNVIHIERPLINALISYYIDKSSISNSQFPIVVTPAGEDNKNLDSLENILDKMSDAGLTRSSLLICIGGGMLTDIGGFAAAIFKRGIRHLNVATTLLGAVDAAVGGKTAIDFRGLKNEIGAFHLPIASLADSSSFSSLPTQEILSGFGEVIKTALISNADMTDRILHTDPLDATEQDLDDFCEFCRCEKMRIVETDPTEKGLRKVLNFGHTAGHAIESLLIEKGMPMPHGSAIAHGNLIALILSHLYEGLDKTLVTRYATWLRRNYPEAGFTCANYDRLWTLATHDKKNLAPDILSYTLLKAPGKPLYDRPISREQLFSAFDIYQELLGR